MNSSVNHHWFVLEAVDLDRYCPVLQAKFRVEDLNELWAILEPDGSADPELDWTYFLEQQDVDAINSRFAVGFTPELLGLSDVEIRISRWRERDLVPYLIHTNYELPLMLDGVKKLSRFADGYPPMTLPIEERFDRWVQEGKFHKEVVIEPLGDKVKHRYLGLRTVYYTLKGEEWRIPAMKLVEGAADAAGGWNEHFERLEGMLFGYENWQSDWWIAQGIERGRYAGRALCCAVNTEGLKWLDAAGFRALPPVDHENLSIKPFDWQDGAAMKSFMMANEDSAALVRFNVSFNLPKDILTLKGAGPWLLPSNRVSQLNRYLLRTVSIICRRTQN